MEKYPVTRQLNAVGFLCPLPVLKARKLLAQMGQGEILEVTATDIASWKDMPAFCKAAGHTLVSATNKDGLLTYVIRCKVSNR